MQHQTNTMDSGEFGSTTEKASAGVFPRMEGLPNGDRVRRNTAPAVLEKLDAETRASIEYYARNGDMIQRRIQWLDAEWTVDRVLMAGVSINVMVGFLLGRKVNRIFFVFPVLVAFFLMQHVIQGWCPPLAILRRAGFRTAREIALEKEALKALRGDFQSISEYGEGVDERVRKAILAAA